MSHPPALLLRSWSFRFASSSSSATRRRLPNHRRPLFASSSPGGPPRRPSPRSKVVVISGPTGAGKSRLALELAKQIGGEIISADSIQVYRGLDVGSAKSLIGEREGIPHHLIDILDPSDEYSVGRFFDDARSATEEILDRRGVPIVVGGTGLYLRWYIYGKPSVPVATAEVSDEAAALLLQLQQSSRWNEAVDLVAEAGDANVRSLPRNDWYRLRRSLEIIKSSGSPPSTFAVPYETFKKQIISSSPDDLVQNLDYEFVCFFLSSPRLELYRSIDLRCEEMVADCPGILSEASWLLDRGLLPNTTSATRAIGYRQAMEFLLHCRQLGAHCSREDLYAFLADFQKASRNFAKRQMTWFRNEQIYQWIDASKPMEEVLSFICDAILAPPGKTKLPNALSMKKDAPSRHESFELKAYRPEKRIFADPENCSRILDWIRRTQLQPSSLSVDSFSLS